jgi:hypothetical protein
VLNNYLPYWGVEERHTHPAWVYPAPNLYIYQDKSLAVSIYAYSCGTIYPGVASAARRFVEDNIYYRWKERYAITKTEIPFLELTKLSGVVLIKED